MAQPTPMDIDDDGVLDLMRDYEALRTWELIRGARSPVTIAELSTARKLEARVLHRHVDLLVHHGLVQAVRARKPRRTVGYRVAVDRIVLAFDDGNPDSVARAKRSAESVGEEFARCVARWADPEFHPKAGFRFRLRSMQHFTAEDFAEIRRLMLPLVEFLSTPRPGPARPARASRTRNHELRYCNQAISIVLDPLVGELLPLPHVWMTPRSKLASAGTGKPERSGIPALAPREREVALALAEGLTRAHIAERMGVSVHTVSTLARRAYRKLGVSTQAALAARLARYDYRRLGER